MTAPITVPTMAPCRKTLLLATLPTTALAVPVDAPDHPLRTDRRLADGHLNGPGRGL